MSYALRMHHNIISWIRYKYLYNNSLKCFQKLMKWAKDSAERHKYHRCLVWRHVFFSFWFIGFIDDVLPVFLLLVPFHRSGSWHMHSLSPCSSFLFPIIDECFCGPFIFFLNSSHFPCGNSVKKNCGLWREGYVQSFVKFLIWENPSHDSEVCISSSLSWDSIQY